MTVSAPLFVGLISAFFGLLQQTPQLVLPSESGHRVVDTGSSRSPAMSGEILVVDGTRERFEQARALIRGLSVDQAMARLAELFLGSPYLAMSLEQSHKEQLRLDLTQFDCMLFVEQLLALVWADSFDDFAEQTRRLRYQNGDVRYCTRQHYFHDWVSSAQTRGLLEQDSVWPGQTTRILRLNFMTSHRDRYPALQSPVLFDCIRAREQGRRIEQRYLPLGALEAALPSLQSGDLFAVATSVGGLDVTHTGVLVREGSRLDAIHAAPGRGVMRSRSFQHYLRSVPDAIGAVIVRPLQQKQS